MATFLASIPSPTDNDVAIGPLTIRAYGLIVLLAIVAAAAFTGYRWTRRGGDWDFVFRMTMWAVAGGIIGARLYHVITSYDEVPDEWYGVFAIWNGGLGIWGAILGGAIAAAIVCKRAGYSVLRMMDVVAPSLLLAQFIGRWGNYFNQELFGTPTSLPWGLEIAPENRPDVHIDSETFHPVFLYESLWVLLGIFVLLAVERRFRINPPGLFALMVAWYTFIRFFMELLRTDPAHEFLGLRVNAYVSIALFVLSVITFIWAQRREPVEDVPKPRPREVAPAGPKMAVPKSRVRQGR